VKQPQGLDRGGMMVTSYDLKECSTLGGGAERLWESAPPQSDGTLIAQLAIRPE